jgi:hypothetical protein
VDTGKHSRISILLGQAFEGYEWINSDQRQKRFLAAVIRTRASEVTSAKGDELVLNGWK